MIARTVAEPPNGPGDLRRIGQRTSQRRPMPVPTPPGSRRGRICRRADCGVPLASAVGTRSSWIRQPRSPSRSAQTNRTDRTAPRRVGFSSAGGPPTPTAGWHVRGLQPRRWSLRCPALASTPSRRSVARSRGSGGQAGSAPSAPRSTGTVASFAVDTIDRLPAAIWASTSAAPRERLQPPTPRAACSARASVPPTGEPSQTEAYGIEVTDTAAANGASPPPGRAPAIRPSADRSSQSTPAVSIPSWRAGARPPVPGALRSRAFRGAPPHRLRTALHSRQGPATRLWRKSSSSPMSSTGRPDRHADLRHHGDVEDRGQQRDVDVLVKHRSDLECLPSVGW